MSRLDQVLIEELFSKRSIQNEVTMLVQRYANSLPLDEIIESVKDSIGEGDKEWSKVNMWGVDIRNAALLIIAKVYLMPKSTLWNSVVSSTAMFLLRTCSVNDATVEDMLVLAPRFIAICAQHGTIRLSVADNAVFVQSAFPITTQLQKRLDSMLYLPPMLCKPNNVENNSESGLITLQENLILKDYNNHDEPLNYAAVNQLNSAKLRLTDTVIQQEVNSVEKPTMLQARNHKKKLEQRATAVELIGKNTMYFRWKTDARGRMYSQGYLINFMGNDYERACIGLAKEEELTQDGKYWLTIARVSLHGGGKGQLTFGDRIKLKNGLSREDAKKPYQFSLLATASITKKTSVLVGQDASSSGTQVLALLSGCKQSMKASNIIDTGTIQDTPMMVLEKINEKLDIPLDVTRKQMKVCYMCSTYGSVAEPRELLGEENLPMYYNTLKENLAGVTHAISKLYDCIDPNVAGYTWAMPDGHTVKVAIRQTRVMQITVPELGDHPFQHTYGVTTPDPHHVSIIAHVTHSVDALIVRTLVLWAGMSNKRVKKLARWIMEELARPLRSKWKGAYKFPLFRLHELKHSDIRDASSEDLEKMLEVLALIGSHEKFVVLPVHDE